MVADRTQHVTHMHAITHFLQELPVLSATSEATYNKTMASHACTMMRQVIMYRLWGLFLWAHVRTTQPFPQTGLHGDAVAVMRAQPTAHAVHKKA